MTTLAKESGRLAWLAATLGEHRSLLGGLLRRLTCMGTPGSMKGSVFKKFLATLSQISLEKEKESEIISRIQAIEAHHRFQRDHKKLHVAGCETSPDGIKMPLVAYEPEAERGNASWLLLTGLFYVMSGRSHVPRD